MLLLKTSLSTNVHKTYIFIRISHAFPNTFLRVVAANSFVEWLKQKINVSIYIFKYMHEPLKANISKS
jgi:hypothetical protein